MNAGAKSFRDLPGVDTLLHSSEIKPLLERHSHELVVYAIHQVLNKCREQIEAGLPSPVMNHIACLVKKEIETIAQPGLKRVINATGVIIHTNLGRAPVAPEILEEAHSLLGGYSNLEFDLNTGKRGSRYSHLTPLLRYLTGAEDILVVNNNAAAVMLILHNMAFRKEVIISRSELIEIGGSFRMPEIMKASGCKMVEVGTTNKTRIDDYAKAISPKTALLFKAHWSNYVIRGFTQQCTLEELVSLGKSTGIPVVYDMGSGLLRRTGIGFLNNEPDVAQTLASGIDLVTFSGDKLLGGPQAGIIAGKKPLIERLKKDPMIRALRVGKTTLALLEAVCRQYLDEERLVQSNPVFSMMKRSPEVLRQMAEQLHKELAHFAIQSEVVENQGQTGGGALPETTIPGYAVEIRGSFRSARERADFSEQLYRKLLIQPTPVLGILRKGRFLMDVLTLQPEEIPLVAKILGSAYQSPNA